MTQQRNPQEVSIIGAGLAGLSLALALHQHGIFCCIYESREDSFNLGGAIMLSPNALRVLDNSGVYSEAKENGFNFEELAFYENGSTELKGSYYFGHEDLYGYKGLRIYRRSLIDIMLRRVNQRKIPVHYQQSFSRVLKEDETGVTFELIDGSTKKTSFLIGADGIHSTVRRYVVDATAKYVGFLGITSAVPTSKLCTPAEGSSYHLPATFQGKTGAFVIAPQNCDGSELFIGTQHSYAEQDRQGWDALREDQQKLLEMLRTNKDEWPDVVQSAMEAAEPGKMNIWPFYSMPTLERWASSTGRVIIIGDAAHAIPPTAGHGVSQAFEDAYALCLLLKSLGQTGVNLSNALAFWESWRQKRIDGVLELTAQMNQRRLPEPERKKLAEQAAAQGKLASDPKEQMKWLYEPKLDEEMDAWVRAQASEQ